MLLKNVKPNLRFFWVLQCVGMSLVLALFAVKVTDNGSLISGDGMRSATNGTDSSDGTGVPNNVTSVATGRCDPPMWTEGCTIYEWGFIAIFVLSVTACAVLFNEILHYADQTPYVKFHVGKVVLGFGWFGLGLGVKFCPSGAFFGFVGIAILIFAWAARGLRCPQGPEGWKEQFSCRALGGGVVVIVARAVAKHVEADLASEIIGAIFELVLGVYLIWWTWSSLRPDKDGHTFNPCRFERLEYFMPQLGWGLTALVNAIGYVCFIWSSDSNDEPLSLGEQLGYDLWMLVWTLLVVGILKAGGGMKCVAFWAAATLLRGNVIDCVYFWYQAFNDGISN